VPRWRILGDFFASCIFSQPRMQHISDLHSKFALGPHHVYGRHPACMVDIQSAAAEIRRGRR